MTEQAFVDATIHRARAPIVQPSFDIGSEFFDALSAGDIDTAAMTFASEGRLLFPGLRPVQGRPLVKRMLGIIRRRYDVIRWEPSRPLIQHDRWMLTSWRVHGTFKDSRLAYENEGVSLIRLESDGKIAMLSDYFKDTLAFDPKARTSH